MTVQQFFVCAFAATVFTVAVTCTHAQSMRDVAVMNSVSTVTSLTGQYGPARRPSALDSISASAGSMVDLNVTAASQVMGAGMNGSSQPGQASPNGQLDRRLSSLPVPASMLQRGTAVSGPGSVASAQVSSSQTPLPGSRQSSIRGKLSKSDALSGYGIDSLRLPAGVATAHPMSATDGPANESDVADTAASTMDQGESQGFFESFKDAFASPIKLGFEMPGGAFGLERACGEACLSEGGSSGEMSDTGDSISGGTQTDQNGKERSSRVLPSRLDAAYGRLSGESSASSRLRGRQLGANSLEPGSRKTPENREPSN